MSSALQVGPDDMNDIRTLHVVSSGSGHKPPSNLRDASNNVWKNAAPTRIAVPTNPSSRTSSLSLNPYNTMGDHTQKHSVGNIAASRTITGAPGSNPRKRQRLDPTFGSNVERLGNVRIPQKSTSIPLAPSQDTPEIINVDEDAETPYIPHRESGSSRNLELGTSHDDPRFPKDGSAMSRLKSRVTKSPSPIEQFTPSPPKDSKVQGLISKFENEHRERYLDLRNVASSMKGKNNKVINFPARYTHSIVTGKTPFRNGTISSRRPSDIFDGDNALHLEKLYVGCELGEIGARHGVIWQRPRKGVKLIVVMGKSIAENTELTLDRDAKSVKSSLWNSTGPSPVIQLRLYKHVCRCNSKGCPAATFITLMAKTSQHDAQRKYQDLVKLLNKQIHEHSHVDAAGARSLWDSAEQVAELSSPRSSHQNKAGTSEQKPLAKRKEPPERSDPESPPPPSVLLTTQCDRRSSNSTTKPAVQTATNDPPDSETAPPPRRSTRNSVVQSRGSPSVDPEEIILIYPPNTTGAVAVKNSDMSRLQPNEFLNDTLIEFGLKLWLKELEEQDPELAKRIHVFSSFFYKKLNTKPAGYESVRKWTAKFDIFEKEFIIVPINENLHWYLAIIYQPQYVLLPPPVPESPRTRRQARKSNVDAGPPTALPELEPVAVEQLDTIMTPDDLADRTDAMNLTPSEAQVEDILVIHTSIDGAAGPMLETCGDLQGILGNSTPSSPREVSQSISRASGATSPSVSDIMRERSADASTTSRDEVMSEGSPSTHSGSTHTLDYVGEDAPIRQNPEQDESASVDDVDDLSYDPTGDAATSARFHRMLISAPAPSEGPVAPGTFYGTSISTPVPVPVPVSIVMAGNMKGKHKEVISEEVPTPAPMDVDEEVEIVPQQKTTYIFTFDSLGTGHPHAIKLLGHYLKLEAKDKKGIENPSTPVGTKALVPCQPNYSDCGVYLLHFARTFAKDPVRYSQLIQKQKGKRVQQEAWQAQAKDDWEDEAVGVYRETLIKRIRALSAEWKKDRDHKKREGAKSKEEKEGTGTMVIDEDEEGATRVKDKGKGRMSAEDIEKMQKEEEEEPDVVEIVDVSSSSGKGRGRGRGRGAASGTGVRGRGRGEVTTTYGTRHKAARIR